MITTTAVIPVAGLLFLFSCHCWINWRQPQPYMDELFHVSQGQEFCAAAVQQRFPSYHASITTLPGLYLPNAILAYFSGSTKACSTWLLRATSALAAVSSLPLLASILRLLQERNVKTSIDETIGTDLNEREWNTQIWFIATIAWLHPVFLFYANLFYTDTSSMFWLLVTWYLSLKRKTELSAVFGFVATCTRQTNMIWHAFIAIESTFYDILPRRKREQSILLHFLASVPRIARQNLGHGFTFVAYVAFLIWNGGVAVGDRSNHEVTVHYAMLPYFLGFHAASYAACQLAVHGQLFQDLNSLRKTKTMLFFANGCFVTGLLVAATGDAVHPFILADNRHFTFYIYRRWLLRSSLRRLALVPLYAWPVLSCRNDISLRGASVVEWGLDVFVFICACITLMPSSLLEPRYMTVGNMILTLRRMSRQVRKVRPRSAGLVSALCIVINVCLLFIFAEMPFERAVDEHMPLDKSPGRFMF